MQEIIKEFKNIQTNEVIKKEKALYIRHPREIKIFLTNHPSPRSENNDGKFVLYSQKHFAECDEFLFGKKEEDKGKYIWLNFPETNDNI